MSLIDVIYSFATGSAEPTSGKYTVTRTPVATYVLGRLTSGGSPTTFLITAGIQPTNGRDLKLLEEAGITSESRKVYTDAALLTRTPGQEPDEITIDGEQWTAHNMTRWEGFGDVIYITLVARKGLT